MSFHLGFYRVFLSSNSRLITFKRDGEKKQASFLNILKLHISEWFVVKKMKFIQILKPCSVYISDIVASQEQILADDLKQFNKISFLYKIV